MGLRVKKETIEISAAAQVMREFANRSRSAVRTSSTSSHRGRRIAHVQHPTASTFVTRRRAPRWLHGNRGVRRQSGAADVLEALGANIMLGPQQVADCVRATGSASCSRPTTTRR